MLQLPLDFLVLQQWAFSKKVVCFSKFYAKEEKNVFSYLHLIQAASNQEEYLTVLPLVRLLINLCY